MTESTIPFIREHMPEGDFLSCIGVNLIKALGSVIIIIMGFIAGSYLFSLQNTTVTLLVTGLVCTLTISYIWLAKIYSFKEFFITTRLDFEDNLALLLKAQGISLAGTGIVYSLAELVILLYTAWYDPLSQAIIKIILLSVITASFFVYAKRDEVWIDHQFNKSLGFHYAFMGIIFGVGVYSLGGIIVLSAELIGLQLTVLGIGLEIVFASVYTYMDLQQWINNYNRNKIASEEHAEFEKERYARLIAEQTGRAEDD